jgi:glycosyltransferase involved in cell wall biosynthesis
VNVATRNRRRVLSIFPTLFGAAGPSLACDRLASNMNRAGYEAILFGNRIRSTPGGMKTVSALPPILNAVPHMFVKRIAAQRLEAQYLAMTQAEDVCHVWPGTSVRLVEGLKAKGAFVVLEMINTPISSARPLLESLYDELGVPAAHGISDGALAKEEAIGRLVDCFFCPSEAVERGLIDKGFSAKILSTSYGSDHRRGLVIDRSVRRNGDRVLIVSVGTVGVRKGSHVLLKLWRDMPENYVLRLVGHIEQTIQTVFADELNLPNVEAVGFTTEVGRHLTEADIFTLPSFEEGDPLSTHEAAEFGLPLVVSPTGGGRLQSQSKCGFLIDPFVPESLREAFIKLGESRDLRLEYGRKTRKVAEDYAWFKVASDRCDLLTTAFGNRC